MAEEYNGAVNHFEVIGSDDAALLLAKNRSWAEGAPSRAEAAMRAVAQADGGTGSNRQRNAIANAIQTMKQENTSTSPIIGRTAFEHLSRGMFKKILQKIQIERERSGHDWQYLPSKWSSGAFIALQTALEASTEAMMGDMALLAKHCRRETILPRDLDSLLVLRRRWGDLLFVPQWEQDEQSDDYELKSSASASAAPRVKQPPVKKLPAAWRVGKV